MSTSKTIQLQQGSAGFAPHNTSASTVADLLNELGQTAEVSTSIGGRPASSGDQLREGDVVSIVATNKKGG